MSTRTIALSAACFAGVLALAGCGSGGGSASQGDSDKIDVVASTNVWGSVAKAVGGDKVSVSSLIDSPEKDPHDYESSAADAAKIAKAKLTVRNGGGYDDFFGKAVKAGGDEKEDVDAFALSGKHGDDVNEHVFYDLPTVKKVADEIAGKLGSIDGSAKETFTQNAKKFDGKIDGLITKARGIGQGKQLSALATESVADYLLEAAGVREATPSGYAEAVEKDQDIPAAAIAETNQLITGHKVSMLVDNTQTQTDTANQLRDNAKRAGLPVVAVTETFPKGTDDYLAWMGAEIEQLAKAGA
ncbi:metal ABC transporter solute-binding protein, Zn/Mn family [Sciscionella marina]|uniref:metal ABC transporter solute-binding protein, Zn/Mn family n=1 Tax=Sciscionella marina TaxID=508770 RepID=UPI00036D594B|nr:zinc ABC transporter substrate-binding protein [Sciscionella marina]